MGRKTPKVCSEPNCPEVTDGQYCQAHQREAWSATRKLYRRNYYGPEWVKARAQQLRDYPYCQHSDLECRCQGHCVRLAVEVDHIVSIAHFPKTKAGRRAAHAPANRQSLCGYCHRYKTMTKDYPGR